MRLSLLSSLLALAAVGVAQQPTQSSNNTSPSLFSSQSASVAPSASANGTASATPTSASASLVPAPQASPNSTASTTNSTLPATPHLHTVVDGTFGVLGVFLLLSGLPLTCYGSRARWSSFAIVGTYAGALVIGLVILRVGVINQFQSTGNLPSSTTRGLFLFASLIAGLLVGGLSLVFPSYSQFGLAPFAGVALGLWILAFKSDGLIPQLAFKLVFLIGLAAVGFVLAVIPSFTTGSIVVGSAVLGASATVLGIDCLTTTGLKEFYVWNVGLTELFPKLQGHYPITLPIQIELACIAALAAAGIATQMRFYQALITKAKELRRADRARDDAERASGRKDGEKVEADLAAWEAKHGDPFRGSRSSSFFGGGGKLERYGSESTGGKRSPGVQEAFLPRLDELAKGEERRAAASPAEPSQWETYLQERQVFVQQQSQSNRKPHRTSSTTLPSSYVLPVIGTDSSDEQLPLAEAMSPPLGGAMSPPLHDVHVRRASSATLLASGRIVELDKAPSTESESHASDDLPLGTIHPRPTTSLGFSAAAPSAQGGPVRSRSSAFVAEPRVARPRPASLGPAHSLSDTVLPRAAQHPSNPRRSSTLLDLNEEEPLPLVGFERRRLSTGPARIITSAQAPRPREEPAQNARIMDLGELEAKHRAKVGQMQGRAKEEAEKAEVKARWERKVAREAEEQRAKEAGRRAAAESLTKKERRQSVGSLGGLLGKGGAVAPTVEEQVDSFMAAGRAPAGTANARRNSQAQGVTRPDLKATRRNSLGSATLLGSLDAMAEFGAGPQRPGLVQTASGGDGRGSRRMSGIDKVAAWQRPVSVSQGVARVASPGPTSPVSPGGATSPRAAKKTDWFGY